MADQYVATTGNDTTGDGTIGNPWATISKGLTQVPVGDTLYIRGGTYSQSLLDTTKTWPTQESERITIRNYQSETVTINPSGSFIWNLKGAVRYVTIQGLIFDGTNQEQDSDPLLKIWTQGATFPAYVIVDGCTFKEAAHHGFQVSVSGAHDFIFRNNTCFNAGRDVSPSNTNSNCIYFKGYNHQIYDNEVYYNNTPNAAQGGLRCYTNLSDPLPKSSNNLIERNFIHGCPISIIVGSGDDNMVRNNVVLEFESTGVQVIGAHGADMTEIYNNTFSNTTAGISYGVRRIGTGPEVTNTQIRNNIFNGVSVDIDLTDATGTVATNNTTASDPGFINIGGIVATDYNLVSGGSAVDAGWDTPSILTDYLQNPRITPYDIGAFEFQVEPLENTVNPTLTITQNVSSLIYLRVTGETLDKTYIDSDKAATTFTATSSGGASLRGG